MDLHLSSLSHGPAVSQLLSDLSTPNILETIEVMGIWKTLKIAANLLKQACRVSQPRWQ